MAAAAGRGQRRAKVQMRRRSVKTVTTVVLVVAARRRKTEAVRMYVEQLYRFEEQAGER